VLGAAQRGLPPYADPYARLFQAATTLREHRGDGHIAALVANDLGPTEVLALRCGMDLTRDWMQSARGWTDEEWDGRAGPGWSTAGCSTPRARRPTPGGEVFAVAEHGHERGRRGAVDRARPRHGQPAQESAAAHRRRLPRRDPGRQTRSASPPH
jgi:hypothetical protein